MQCIAKAIVGSLLSREVRPRLISGNGLQLYLKTTTYCDFFFLNVCKALRTLVVFTVV